MSTVTLALVKSWLQIGHTAQDDVIQLMIDGAESFLAQYLNLKFTSEDYEEDLDSALENEFQRDPSFFGSQVLGNGASFLIPNNRPVTAVESVLDLQDNNASLDFRQQGDLLAYTDAQGNFLGSWPPGLQRFRVSYTAGYDSDTLPAVIKEAVCMLAARKYNARDGQNAMAANGAAVAFGELMDSAIIKMVQPHSRRRVTRT